MKGEYYFNCMDIKLNVLFQPRVGKKLSNSCNTGMSALPDMYARSPRAAGPRAEGIHIRQSTSACVTTNMLHFRHS